MDSKVDLYLKRADDELLLAKINFDISTKENLKDILNIEKTKTFFNDVISEAYYSIFYSAKAYLLAKGIETKPPEEHKKTYLEFKKFIESGELNNELLELYEKEADKAEALLNIFFEEKKKRGNFVYNMHSQANIPYAEESISNSRKFISAIKGLLKK